LTDIRVCFVSSYPPNRARLSEYAEALVSELAKRNLISKIYVIADVAKGISRNTVSGKIEVRRVWKPDNLPSILGILWQIWKLNPDLVHFNVHFQSFGRTRIANFTGLSLAFLSQLLGKKSLMTIHNFGEKVDIAKCQIKPSPVTKAGIILATKIISMTSCVSVTVKSYIDYLTKKYSAKKVVYVPHGVWNNPIKSLTLYNGNPNRTILILGHMGPYKGLQVLLDAFNALVKDRADIRLIVAGGDHPNFPGFLDVFKQNCTSNIKFTGYIEKDELPKFFEEASVVVLPYLTSTGTSGVFHLACGYEKPIIASDLPEMRELVNEGASLLLVPPGNPKKLSDAIQHVLDNPEEAYEIVKRNQVFTRERTWDKVAEMFEMVYRDLKVNNIADIGS